MRDHLEWLSGLAEADLTARGTKWIPSTVPALTQAGAVGAFTLPLRSIDSPFGDIRPALEANLMQDIGRMVLLLHLPRESAYVADRTTIWFWDHAFKVDAVDGTIELPWRASVTRPNERVDPTMKPLPAWSINVELGHVNHLFVSGTTNFFELPRTEASLLAPLERVKRFLARRETSESVILPVHNKPAVPRLSGWSHMEVGPIATAVSFAQRAGYTLHECGFCSGREVIFRPRVVEFSWLMGAAPDGRRSRFALDAVAGVAHDCHGSHPRAHVNLVTDHRLMSHATVDFDMLVGRPV